MTLAGINPTFPQSQADRAELREERRSTGTAKAEDKAEIASLPQLLKSSKVLFSEVLLDQLYEWKQTRKLLLSVVSGQCEYLMLIEETLGQGAHQHPLEGGNREQ